MAYRSLHLLSVHLLVMGSCFDEDWDGPTDDAWQQQLENDHYGEEHLLLDNVVDAAVARAERFSLWGDDDQSLQHGENDVRRQQYLEECFSRAGSVNDGSLISSGSQSILGASKVPCSNKATVRDDVFLHKYGLIVQAPCTRAGNTYTGSNYTQSLNSICLLS